MQEAIFICFFGNMDHFSPKNLYLFVKNDKITYICFYKFDIIFNCAQIDDYV